MVSAITLLLLAAAAPAGAASDAGLVKNIRPSGSSNPTNLTQAGNTLFFVANDGVHGRELWKSNGTAAGTQMVKDIRTGSKGSNPEYLVNVNGTLFFQANNGTTTGLWKSDGTKVGTVRIKEPVLSQPATIECPGEMYYAPVVVGSRLFYFEAGAGCALSINLYVTDGTAAGTHFIDAGLAMPKTARLSASVSATSCSSSATTGSG